MTSVLLESKPYRPFKSSEEYLEAMKEDLAEWLNVMYPELNINAENFMSRLDTGVALCKHANNVRQAAEDYLAKRQARNKSMTRSMTSGLAGPILANLNVHYLPAAKSGTFFARDNVSNFITWCRKSLKIFECLLFETDDLIMRKNEKHVILCLLEVARRGAKFGMLAPMLVQMERQIDREIAADNRANGITFTFQVDNNEKLIRSEDIFESDSEDEDDGPMLLYGPQPQIVTNDLKSLDDMVRDLVEKCTCPSQFPMVRVSEGKYRIGDTKVLIFVRILRSHVMVRVGGGWDTLAHYLDKHDPCRCKSAHRSAVSARLIPRTTNQSSIELHKAHIIYERSPPPTRKILAHTQISSALPNLSQIINTTSSTTMFSVQSRSRSPTPQRKFVNQQYNHGNNENISFQTAPMLNMNRRSMSPSPRRLTDIRKKQYAFDINNQSKLAYDITQVIQSHVQIDTSLQPKEEVSPSNNNITIGNLYSNSIENSSKYDNTSDNGSEISDEGYRSLGLQQINHQKFELHQQAITDDADYNARLPQNSCDVEILRREGKNKIVDIVQSIENITDQLNTEHSDDSLKLNTKKKSVLKQISRKNSKDSKEVDTFEQSGVFVTDDDITIDIASATGLRKTGFADRIYGGDDVPLFCVKLDEKIMQYQNKPETCINIVGNSKIPISPKTIRRRSIDTLSEKNNIITHDAFSKCSRTQPEYHSARLFKKLLSTENHNSLGKQNTSKGKSNELNSIHYTWNGRNKKKLNPIINEHPIRSSSLNSHFDKKLKQCKSHILYDSNGKRVCSKSTSLTTSPVKYKNITSPLAQQLLKVANNAKTDAQMLEKMKILLQQYGKEHNFVKKDNFNYNGLYTSEWVHNNGDLDRSDTSSSSSEIRKFEDLKRNTSVISSDDIKHSNQILSLAFIPKSRIDHRGISKIPAPVRRNTELY